MKSFFFPTSSKGYPRLALIGCGAIAENYYLPALSTHPSILSKLILVDRDRKRAHDLTKKYKAGEYSDDYHEILNRIDGAIVAVPTHLHYEIAKDFILSGVPVLCEKPLADTGINARNLVQLASQKNVTLAVNYFQRLIPAFIKVKEFIKQKSLGEPLSIKYFVREEFNWPTVSGFYFNAPLSSRGILRDRGTHAIDHICWWLESKPRLLLSLNDAFGGSEAVAHIIFEAGKCRGELKLGWLASSQCIYKIVCEDGIIEGKVYDYQNLFIQSKWGRKHKIHLKSQEKTKIAISRKILNNFIEVVNNHAKPLISGSDVLDSIDFIDECYKTAERFSMPWYEGLRSNDG